MIEALIQKVLKLLEPNWSPTLYKGALGAVLVGVFVAPLLLVPIPMIEFFNGMAAQPKGKSQMTHGRTFGDEILLERRPIAGTVPRDWAPYPFDNLGNTIEEAEQAGAELANPVPVERAHLERGREVYNVYCIVCHGKLGHGDGTATGPDRFPAPPSLHTEQAQGYADGTVFHIITKGVEKMPGYAEQIEPPDRWKAVRYVRVLQRAADPKPEDLEP